MEHFYQNIDGWFNFEDLYREMVREAKDRAEFVEIGAWKGKSSAFMAVEIINSEKDIILHVVDHFQGSEEHQTEGDVVEGILKQTFLSNTAPVEDVIQLWPMHSALAVSHFEDRSLDFVFIDAAHDYESVKEDITMWLPKVKRGGVIAGDDYSTWPGVKQAVDEIFPNAEKRGIYWAVRL